MVSFETLKTLRDGYESSQTVETLMSLYELEKNVKEILVIMGNDTKDCLLRDRINLHLRNLEFIESIRRKNLMRLSRDKARETNYKSGVQNEKGIRKIEQEVNNGIL